jgi:rhodanese-related sulfurtransferase
MAMPLALLPLVGALGSLPLAPLAPIVLDVRTQAEWDAGHVSCAQRIPVQDDPALIDQVKNLASGDLTVPIVTYCHSGVRAGAAETALTDAGFTYVRNGGGYAIPAGNTAQLESLCSCCSVPTVAISPGLEMPMIVMGTGSGQKGDVENATATWLAQAGGTGIDTAYGYHDEDGIKAGLKDVKANTKPFSQMSHIFLETKIPCSDYATASAALQSNLDQLGVDKVQLTLIHFPCRGSSKATGNSETWRAMEDFMTGARMETPFLRHFLVCMKHGHLPRQAWDRQAWDSPKETLYLKTRRFCSWEERSDRGLKL